MAHVLHTASISNVERAQYDDKERNLVNFKIRKK